MSDLTKIIYMKNLSYHFLVKGGGAKTYLEKRENIFIKGGRIQRGKNTFKFSFNCNIYLYYFHFFEPTMSINIAQYTPKYRQRGFDNWFQYYSPSMDYYIEVTLYIVLLSSN